MLTRATLQVWVLGALAALPPVSLHAQACRFRRWLRGPRCAVQLLHRFATTPGRPTGALVQVPDGSFYGATQWGGDTGRGTIFAFTSSGEVPHAAHVLGSRRGHVAAHAMRSGVFVAPRI